MIKNILLLFLIVLSNYVWSNGNAKKSSVFDELSEIDKKISQNPDSALVLFLEFQSKLGAPDLANDSLQCKLLSGIAKAYMYLNEIDSSIVYYEKSLGRLQNLNCPKINGDILHLLGNNYLRIGNYNNATQYYIKASKIKKELPDRANFAKTLSNLGIVYLRLGNPDSSLYYHNKALVIRQKLNDSVGMAKSYSNLGNINLAQTNLPNSLAYYKQAKLLIDTTVPSPIHASLTSNIGNIYFRQGEYSKALSQFVIALGIYEFLDNAYGMAKVSNNIALVNLELQNIDKAMKYHTEALNYFILINDEAGVADTYFYLGRVYHEAKNYKKAGGFYSLSLKIEKQIGDINGIADCMHNLGVIKLDKGQIDSSIFYLKEANKTYILLENSYGQANTLNNLAQAYLKNKRYERAYSYADKALGIAKEYEGLAEMIDSYGIMAVSKEQLNESHDALESYKMIVILNDSLFKKQKTEIIIELENKYQLERKQKALEEQSALLMQQNLEIQYQNRQFTVEKHLRNTLFASLFVLLILFIVILRNLYSKKAINSKLINQQKNNIEKNKELEYLNAELEDSQHQIQMQNEVLIEQNTKIEDVNVSWKESVTYAQYIQQAVLPSSNTLKSILHDYYLLYLPKDIVGGDFYWAYKNNNKTIVAVGDCTGHGVPGGFLSMMGMAFLKEIVTVKSQFSSHLILDELRNLFMESLHQQFSMLKYNNGIDLSIVIVDSTKDTLEYAGANSKLLIVNNNECKLLKGDRMTVGHSPKQKPFSSEVIKLSKGDGIYMFTDGFADQYNDKGEKYGGNRMLSLFEKSHAEPMNIQKEILYNSFDSWRNNYEQIDDITVLAFKYKV